MTSKFKSSQKPAKIVRTSYTTKDGRVIPYSYSYPATLPKADRLEMLDRIERMTPAELREALKSAGEFEAALIEKKLRAK